MTIQLSTKQALALRKAAQPLLRKHGINPEDHSLHAMTWRSLNDLEADTKREARALLDKISDNADSDKVADLEAAHDGMMQIYDAITAEKDTRSAIGDRGPRDSARHPNTPNLGDGVTSAISGRDTGEFSETSVALRSDQRVTDWLMQSRRGDVGDLRGLGLGAYLRAMVVGPQSDAERRALSEGSDSAGGFTVPTVLSSVLIDRLRAASTVIRAGAQTVPLTSDNNTWAKVVSDPTPAWRNEAAEIATSDPVFGQVVMTPRSLGVLVKISRELLEDSLNVSSELPRIIAEAMAAEVDRVALLGTGTAPQPRGIASFSGLTSNTFAGGELTYNALISARTALRTANVEPNALILHPRDLGQLESAVDSTGQPIMPHPGIAALPMLTSTRLPVNLGTGTDESKAILGDFTKLAIGVRTELRIEILRERFGDVGQYAFLALLRCDIAATHENAFTVLSGITLS